MPHDPSQRDAARRWPSQVAAGNCPVPRGAASATRTRRAVLAALARMPVAAALTLAIPALAASAGPVPSGLETFPLRRDREGRALIRATIDGHGDCDLVIDTAATRSALASDAVDRLRLPIAPGGGVRVHGTTGATRLPLARVPRLGAGDARLEAANLPVLPRDAVSEADGLLGTDALAGCTLALDFVRGTVAISRRTRVTAGDALAALHRYDGAIAVGAHVGTRVVPAILDTGAARTLGTPALAALCEGGGAGEAGRRSSVRGVDLGYGETLECDLAELRLAQRNLGRASVGCIALTAFDVWRIGDRPALLLGMDVLGRLEGLRLDFESGLVAVA